MYATSEATDNILLKKHTLNLIGANPACHGTPDANTTDLFNVRRNNSGSGNPRDIEGTLFQSEIEAGLTYSDRRQYRAIGICQYPERVKAFWVSRALAGKITDVEILQYFPRVKAQS